MGREGLGKEGLGRVGLGSEGLGREGVGYLLVIAGRVGSLPTVDRKGWLVVLLWPTLAYSGLLISSTS